MVRWGDGEMGSRGGEQGSRVTGGGDGEIGSLLLSPLPLSPVFCPLSWPPVSVSWPLSPVSCLLSLSSVPCLCLLVPPLSPVPASCLLSPHLVSVSPLSPCPPLSPVS